MTIIIHKYPDSPLEIPKYTIIPFKIEGTDIQGEAKLGALLTVTDPIISSDKIQQLIKEEQPLNIVLEINENEQEVVGLIYRTPRMPSE